MEPAAQLLPLTYWMPLAAALLIVQLALGAAVARTTGRRPLSAAVAVLSVDLLIVAALRACVAHMGAMDYSETFFTWRLWFLALCVLLVPVPIALWTLALWLPHGRTRPSHRARAISPYFLGSLGFWLSGVVLTLLFGGDLSFLPRPARITPVEVRLPGLDERLDGLRVALLSDHHVGALMTPARARRRLESLARARADVVVALGDLTDTDPSYQPAAIRVLEGCRAPLGVYAVSGNFDVGAGTDSLRAGLRGAGIRYLENEAVRVSARGADLWIAGVGDPWSEQADLDLALKPVPEGAPVILLAHSPDLLEQARARRVPLVLCGHTHGGQVVAPFAGPMIGMSRYGTRFAAGHFATGNTHLVVSRGLGEEAIPLRLFCRPEIVVVTLRAG